MKTLFEDNKDGTVSFLVDADKVEEIKKKLGDDGFRIIDEGSSVFDSKNDEVSDIALTVEGSIGAIAGSLSDFVSIISSNPEPTEGD